MALETVDAEELAQLRRIDQEARKIYAVAERRKYCPWCTRHYRDGHVPSCPVRGLAQALFDGRPVNGN